MKFTILHNLESLSEDQRKQYLRDASVFLGLDPDLNGLDTIWMNNDDGLRKLTVYARRGTTDILRGIHGISVLSLEQHDGPGYVSFKAAGSNPKGRQEVAVGAAAIEGLKGEKLAAAVATAQTRALRRLTLQFVGGGVLDESEVTAVTTNIASQSTPLSQLALAPNPSVAPSSAPGKDITPKVECAPLRTVEFVRLPGQRIDVTDEELEQLRDGKSIPELLAARGDAISLAFPSGESSIVSDVQEDFEKRQAKLRADAINTLNQNTSKEGVSLQDVAPKKRKTRGPNKAKVNLGPSEPPVQSVKQDLPAPQPAPIPAAIPAPIPVQSPEPIKADVKADVKSDVIASKPRLTRDQVKPFSQRLFRIVNDYLEPNGFIPKEGLGNGDKMRSFASIMFPDIINMNDLSIEQWEKYLTTIENKIKIEGPAAAVKYIEDAIGIN